MDVVNLHENRDTPPRACIVTDSILELTLRRSGCFTIYVLFREAVTLSEPFKLVVVEKNTEITEIIGAKTKYRTLVLWKQRNALPAERRPNEVIRLNFHKTNDDLFFTLRENLGNIFPENIISRSFPNAYSKPQIAIHLVFPVDVTKLLVLSDQSYSLYLISQGVFKPNPIACLICYETSEHAFTMYKCGHCLCELCYCNHKCRSCPICRTETADKAMVRIKLRQGPCPIDMCTEVNKETRGVIVIPCGCHVNCHNFEEQVVAHKNNMTPILRKYPLCPYEACKRGINDFQIPLFYDN